LCQPSAATTINICIYLILISAPADELVPQGFELQDVLVCKQVQTNQAQAYTPLPAPLPQRHLPPSTDTLPPPNCVKVYLDSFLSPVEASVAGAVVDRMRQSVCLTW